MKLTKLLTLVLIIALYSCNETPNKSKMEMGTPILGEDKAEIDCLVTDIYEIEGSIYIDLDFVEIKYENIDERVVVNQNPKIRTYMIDSKTLIYSYDCQEVEPEKLISLKSKLTSDDAPVTVGTSKNGKMESINFGCYE